MDGWRRLLARHLVPLVLLLLVARNAATTEARGIPSTRPKGAFLEQMHRVTAAGARNRAFDHAVFDPAGAMHNRELKQALSDGFDEYGDSSEYDDAYDDGSVDEDELDYEDLFGDIDSDDFVFHSDTGQWDLDVDARLDDVFPRIDANGDGEVSVHELTDWHSDVGTNASRKRAEREVKLIDSDNDGRVSLNELVAGNEFRLSVDQTELPGNIDASALQQRHGSSEWVNSMVKQFHIVDRDKNGFLDLDEYMDFLHPEESGNRELMDQLARDDVRKRDQDGDMRISWTEFSESLWLDLIDFSEENPLGTASDEFVFPGEGGNRWMEKFKDLDANQDGYIDEYEIRAVTLKLHPRERDIAREEAEFLMHDADDDGNGKLSLDEMKNNRHVFYGTAFQTPNYDDDEFDLHESADEGWLRDEL